MKFGGWTGLFLMARRSLRQHLVSTIVTTIAIALGVGLVLAVFAISAQARQAFTGGNFGFDAVLGARGSQLQLVLNTVFHLETSPGNIPYQLYKDMKAMPDVDLAIPYAVGDNYKGFRIVGTTDEIFTRFEYQKGKRFQFSGKHQRPFNEQRQEAVIGAVVAQQTGLKYGDVFQPYHGLNYTKDSHQHSQDYVIVGVLQPTNTPSDRVIWIPIEGIYRMDGHSLKNGTYKAKPNEQIPDKFKEVSAVMLKFKSPVLGRQHAYDVNNRGKVATMAYPIGKVMLELFDKIGWVTAVLEAIAYLVVVVSVSGMFAAIYNTMNERRRDMAIMRALGARRSTLMAAIVLESILLVGLGLILGYVVYFVILTVASSVIREQTGVVLSAFAWHPVLAYLPPAALVFALIAGLAPALKAYRTDIARNLTPIS